MRYTDRLREILSAQHEQNAALAAYIEEIEQTDLAGENERLRKAVEVALAESGRLTADNKRLMEENKRLSAGLNEQLIIERLGILRRSREQLTFYFGHAEDGLRDRLTVMEEKYKALLNALKVSAERDIAKTEPLLKEKLAETEAFFQKTLAELQALNRKKNQAINGEMQDEFDALTAEPPPSGTADRLRFFNLEMRFGMKIVNLMGVLLILLGVVFGLQYTYYNLLRSNELKAAAAYLLGFLFLAGGELSRRKFRGLNHFAVGITAGGLGILFASTAISYFNLQVMGSLAAAGMCVLISLAAFALSLRYNARTVASIALVGGYLPLTALTGDTGMAAVVGVYVYLTLLNALSLGIATRKKWPFLNGLCFALYTLGSMYVLARFGQAAPDLFGIMYLLINFALFTAAVLIYPALHAKEKELVSNADIALLTGNTIVGCVYLYGLLNAGVTGFAFNGLLAVLFCFAFAAAAYLTGRFIPAERRVRALFALTTLTFAVLAVPFQYGLDGLLIGWLAEGVLLLCYGVVRREKWFERAGIGVFALAGVALIPVWLGAMVELAGYLQDIREHSSFFIDYTLTALGLGLVCAAYYYVHKPDTAFAFTPKGRRVQVLYYTAALFGLVYLLYAAAFVFINVTDTAQNVFWGRNLSLLLIGCGFAYGAGVKYIKALRGDMVFVLSLCVTGICLLAAATVNAAYAYHPGEPGLSRGVLIVFNLIAVAAAFECTRCIQMLTARLKGLLPLAVSLYALVLVVSTLMNQYGYQANSIVLSAIGMLASFGWIWFGFMGRNRIMRLFGLGFALLATSKLFLIDLYFLESLLRIVSYFVFGVVLLSISFVYQYFNKKLTRLV